MEPKLHVIETLEDFKKLEAYISDKDLISYDTETTGLTARDEIIGFSICADELEAFYVVLAKWSVEEKRLYYLETKDYAKDFISLLAKKQLIMHNAIFDCFITEAYFKISLIDSVHTDTMVAAHLLDDTRRVGLKELGHEFFGESATKEQAEMKASVIKNGGAYTAHNKELYKADYDKMALYGAKDAILTYKLFLRLVEQLFDEGLDKFFYEDECMPLLRGPTYQLNTTGLTVDLVKLASLKTTLLAECAAHKDFIYTEIDRLVKEKYPGNKKTNTFNIGSSSQLSWLLFGEMKQEFKTLTKEGKTVCKALGLKLPYFGAAKRDFISSCLSSEGQIYQPEATVNGKKQRAKKVRAPWYYIQCDKTTLVHLATKFKWVKALLDYKKKLKILDTYVEGIQERVQYGVIHPSFLQTGTKTGRYSSRNPNFQNLPRGDQRVKECIVARPGKVFVGADYSQLEPRVFAYYSQEEKLMNAFNGETDFYSVIGIDTFDKFDAKPIKEGDPDAFGVKYKGLRDISKVVVLSAAYGTTPFKLAPTIGRSIEDTQEIIDNMFERFSGIPKMMLEAHSLVKKQGYVTNLFGRPRRLPEGIDVARIYGDTPHAELPYDARNVLNAACNHRIQSTGASIVNRAAIAFYEKARQLKLNARIACQIHDELIIECDEAHADIVNNLLRECMEKTTELPGVPLEALPRITKSLAK